MKKNYATPCIEIDGMVMETELLDISTTTVTIDLESNVDAENIESRNNYNLWDDED